VGYAALVAVRGGGLAEPRGWLAGASALVMAAYFSGRASRLARWLGAAVAVVVASFGAREETRAIALCGTVGASACAALASYGVARIPAPSGAVPRTPVSSGLGLVVIAGSALAVAVARLVPDSVHREVLAVAVRYPNAWVAGAMIVSVVVIGVMVEWTAVRRSLEIGMEDRARAMRALWLLTTMVVGTCGLIANVAPGRLARLVVAAVGAVVGLAALEPDAVRVARVARRAVALGVVGGGIALVGASCAAGRGIDARWIVLMTAALTLAVGAGISRIESPLRPERGRWLDACNRAGVDATWADAEDAVRDILMALRVPGGPASASPRLWTFQPPETVTVDAAGYVHRRVALPPENLAALANAEPERTLRASVVRALEVRRPELRAASKWMTDEGALVATAIEYGGEMDGVLVLPEVPRAVPFTLEEARALRRVTDRIAAACRVRATLARTLARAEDARRRSDRAEAIADRALSDARIALERNALATRRLAAGSTAGVYAAASRLALEAIERRMSAGGPLALIVPSGVDPLPYLARAHLHRAHGDGAFVAIDCTNAREHDVGCWKDRRTSPLALADGGILVLLDVGALPAEVQQVVAYALAHGRPPWDSPDLLDIQLATTGVVSPEELVGRGRLDPGLATLLGDALSTPVTLPRLRDRSEDLRNVLTDHLAREGLRALGRPIGIEREALVRLVDYPYPGEEAELAGIVRRLVARCEGDIVRAADVDAVHPAPADASKTGPLSV
jgi:hypothetical protein